MELSIAAQNRKIFSSGTQRLTNIGKSSQKAFNRCPELIELQPGIQRTSNVGKTINKVF